MIFQKVHPNHETFDQRFKTNHLRESQVFIFQELKNFYSHPC